MTGKLVGTWLQRLEAADTEDDRETHLSLTDARAVAEQWGSNVSFAWPATALRVPSPPSLSALNQARKRS